MPNTNDPSDGSNFRHVRPSFVRNPSGLGILTTIAVVAALYFGRDLFLPLAIAMLIAFALSPLVSRLRGFGVPLIASVLAAVTLAFAAIGLFGLVVAGQLGDLARELPTFQGNIVKKLEALQSTGRENGLVSRLSRMVADINAEISQVVPETITSTGADRPLAVEVVEKLGVVDL